MTTLAERMRMAFERNPNATQAELARICGIRQPSVHAWFSGETKSIKAEPLRRAAHYLGCDPYWLSTGNGLPNWRNSQHAAEGLPTYTVAHGVSHPSPIVLPLQLEWDTIMQGSLPDQFVLPLRDAALQPRFTSTTRLIFATGRTPQPGDVVLLRDNAGELFVREYHLVRGNHWRAAATNPAYQPLDSAAEGLQVLAVAVGALWA